MHTMLVVSKSRKVLWRADVSIVSAGSSFLRLIVRVSPGLMRIVGPETPPLYPRVKISTLGPVQAAAHRDEQNQRGQHGGACSGGG